MKVLVTGSTGFIGSQLCRALIVRGDAVRAFHRPSSSLAALESLPVEHVIGDILQPETLLAAMQGVEAVFHVAATLGRNAAIDPGYLATTQGTHNVWTAARQCGVRRLVHTSSVAALGVPSGNQPVDERHTWNIRPEWWDYGYAKYRAEMEVQRAVAGGLDAVIVNPAVVLGPGDLNRISGDIVVQIARRPLPVSVTGGLNVIHVDDVVAGHLAALECGRCGERYILSGENLTHQRFLTLIAQAVGVRPPRGALPGGLVRPLAVPLSWVESLASLPISGRDLWKAGRYFYFSNAKARSELGVALDLAATKAIQDAVVWYRKRGEIG